LARPALAATRALDIISYFTEHADESFTMAQLTRALHLNQGSAHAILSALVEDGFLVRHRAHKTYRLGPALVAVGEAATRANPVIAIAQEELQVLADELGLEALASMRTGGDLRVVVRVGRHSSRAPARRVGQRYPLVPPLGAALVAWSPDDVRDEWVSAGAEAGTMSRARLDALLAQVRATGVHVGSGGAARGALGAAVEELSETPHDAQRAARVLEEAARIASAEQDDSHIRDVAAIAAPVLGPDGDAVLECVVHGFREQPPTERVAEVIEALRHSCTVIARRTWEAAGRV
jgi:DNA-binding IclR family transcriptional regulator